MIINLLRSPTFWIGLLLLSVIAPAMWFIPRPEMFELQNGVIAAVAIGIWFGFFKAAVDIVSRKTPRELMGDDMLILGVFIAWTGICAIFIGLWVFRITEDFYFANHWTGVVFRWVLIIGGICHLAAAGAKDGIIPRKSYMITGAWFAVGIGVALVLISLGIR